MCAGNVIYQNLQQSEDAPYPHNLNNRDKEYSPEDCVSYVKELLRTGHTWNSGVRRYVSLQFRGTILYSYIIRFMTGLGGEAYKWEKWGLEFIELLDEEFKVTKEGSYQEKGSAFRKSFRIGIMMSHFINHSSLRAQQVHGPYPMSEAIDKCIEISDMAKSMDVPHGTGPAPRYMDIQWEVASVRKPLALAHSAIGSMLGQMKGLCSLKDFKQIATHHGLLDGEDCDPFALMASHYKIAAENELPDATDAPIYWWAYAGNMAMADPKSGFTMGLLRDAMRKAQDAEKARDITLFGADDDPDGSYQLTVKTTAYYFREKEDSFVMPQLVVIDERKEGRGISLKDGEEVLCNLEQAVETYARLFEESSYGSLAHNDTREAEREYGQDFHPGVPSLETLCIRELHKSGCEYAKGESDGAVIHFKAMMAMAAEDKLNH